MRVRKQTPDGDMRFGNSMGDIWYNHVEGVGQCILTRLLLYRGEWFLDRSDGTPWGEMPFNRFVIDQGEILGTNTPETRDLAIRQRVLYTPGVSSILNFSSNTDPDMRILSVNMLVDTIYGRLSISGSNGELLVSAQAVPPSRRLR